MCQNTLVPNVPDNQAVPEYVIDPVVVARMERLIAAKLAPVMLSRTGDCVAVADGRVFMWFDSKQKVGEIVRREYQLEALGWLWCAVHFKIMGPVKHAEVRRCVKLGYTRTGGYWYAVHGD